MPHPCGERIRPAGSLDLWASDLFCLVWEGKWVRLVNHGKWVRGTGREACPTLSYSTGGGWGLKSNLGKWGKGRIYSVEVGVNDRDSQCRRAIRNRNPKTNTGISAIPR